MCSPLDTLIIPHFVGFVKGFFNFFSFRSIHQLDPTYRVGLLSPLDILIIAHLVPFVKRFFQLFFRHSVAQPHGCGELLSPLDNSILSHLEPKCKW